MCAAHVFRPSTSRIPLAIAFGALILLCLGSPAWAGSILDEVRGDPRFKRLMPEEQQRIENAAISMELDRFSLHTNCHPVYVVMEEPSEDALRLGLRRDEVSNRVQARLRAAGLYSVTPQYPYLNISILVVGEAFGVDVGMKKRLLDTPSYDTGGAVTWQETIVGTHAGGIYGGNYILESLDTILDLFVKDYLRVNEEACSP